MRSAVTEICKDSLYLRLCEKGITQANLKKIDHVTYKNRLSERKCSAEA